MLTPDFSFQVPFACGTVDKANAVIRGVSIMTGDLTAIGHDLEVDDTTLSQVLACAKAEGKVPVKNNHGSGVENINGYLDNFYLDGKKVRGDWHLLVSHEETPKMLERAERMPGCFGLSAAFKGEGSKVAGGKKAARCSKLLAVDCVTAPAANPGGLFSAKPTEFPPVDKPKKGMPTDPNAPVAEPTIADLLAAFNNFQTEVTAQIGELGQAVEALQNGDDADAPLTAEQMDELMGASDEQLAAIGLTRAEVNQAHAEMTAAVDGAGGNEGNEGAGGTGGTGGNTSYTGAGQSLATTAMSAGQQALREVHQFKAQLEARERNEARQEEEHAFSVIEAKTIALAEINDALVIELASKDAEIDALRLTVRTGVKPVGAGVEATLFSAGGAKAGSYPALVTAKFAELVKAGKSEAAAKSEAINFCVSKHPGAYQEWRENGAAVIEFQTK